MQLQVYRACNWPSLAYTHLYAVDICSKLGFSSEITDPYGHLHEVLVSICCILKPFPENVILILKTASLLQPNAR